MEINIGQLKSNAAAARALTQRAALRRWSASVAIAALMTLPAATSALAAGATPSSYRILATNDLGMHCVDADFSVFSILPPYNVLNAQVIRLDAAGRPKLVDDSAVTLRYEAIRDRDGSMNSSCRTTLGTRKSNFWNFADEIYGANLRVGEGLKGLYMPKDAPSIAARSLTWNSGQGLFKAEGIPILPVDDDGQINRYPLVRVAAFDKTSGSRLAGLNVVLPVSEETTCSNCHATGAAAASSTKYPDVAWSRNARLEVQSRENVLKLHDRVEGTALFARHPVLCAECHYSRALDLAGSGPGPSQVDHRTMSAVMHDFHADKMRSASGVKLFDTFVRQGQALPSPGTQTCYQCHPGKSTQCLRGAMTDSITCQNCHGGMKAVGGASPLRTGGSIDGLNDGGSRRPWLDLPRCQSCHTGDAVSHRTMSDPSLMATDGLRRLVAFAPSDPAASPFKSTNKRFAENEGKLYRFSKGHGGVACEGCHNSTHAIWENPDATHNDNVAARQLQGHNGTIAECSACHAPGSLPRTLGGPHGMHNVDDSVWMRSHGQIAEGSLIACARCHGQDYRGTVLSRTASLRTWSTEFGTKTVAKGHPVGCYDCHNGPGGGD